MESVKHQIFLSVLCRRKYPETGTRKGFKTPCLLPSSLLLRAAKYMGIFTNTYIHGGTLVTKKRKPFLSVTYLFLRRGHLSSCVIVKKRGEGDVWQRLSALIGLKVMTCNLHTIFEKENMTGFKLIFYAYFTL